MAHTGELNTINKEPTVIPVFMRIYLLLLAVRRYRARDMPPRWNAATLSSTE
jgi:hypothetical protein